jgi:hypothetical protein
MSRDWKSFYWKWHVELGLVVVTMFLFIGAFALWTTRSTVEQQSERGAQAYKAVCALRGDVQGRIHSDREKLARSREFLRAHPRGTHDFTALQIQAAITAERITIRSEQHTVFSLRILEC